MTWVLALWLCFAPAGICVLSTHDPLVSFDTKEECVKFGQGFVEDNLDRPVHYRFECNKEYSL